jgi:hypothetical protein
MPVENKKPAHNSWPSPPSDSTVEEQRTRLKKEADVKYKTDSIHRQLYSTYQGREEKNSKSPNYDLWTGSW